MEQQRKTVFIHEIRENQTIDDLFLVKMMNLGETKNGKPYIAIVLMDASGDLTGRIWDNATELAPLCPVGAVVRVQGTTQTFKGEVQLKIDQLQQIPPDQVAMKDFMPASSQDSKAMLQALGAIVDTISNDHIRTLLERFLQDNAFVQSFQLAPAAKHMHHAYLSGLLEHTLSMSRVADQLCRLYPQLDRSLLLAGVFLHDIGKVREFSYEMPPFEYTDQGRLVGHMVIAIEMVQEKIASMADFPADLGMKIKHLILSHHGCHEFGSPTVPMLREAFVLNFIDDMDAKMNYFDKLAANMEEDQYQWTDFQKTLQRFLFLKPSSSIGEGIADGPAHKASKKKKAAESDGQQQSLWG